MIKKNSLSTTDDIFSELIGYGHPDNAIPDIKYFTFTFSILIFAIYFLVFGQKYLILSFILIFNFYFIQIHSTSLEGCKSFYICNSIKNTPSIFLSMYTSLVLIFDTFLIQYDITKYLVCTLLLYSTFCYYYLYEYNTIFKCIILSVLYFVSVFYTNVCLRILVSFYSSLLLFVFLKITCFKLLGILFSVKYNARYNFRRSKTVSFIVYLLFGVVLIYN